MHREKKRDNQGATYLSDTSTQYVRVNEGEDRIASKWMGTVLGVKAVGWLRECSERKQDCIQASAENNHCIQSCDASAYKEVSHNVTKTKDALMTNGIVSTGNVDRK